MYNVYPKVYIAVARPYNQWFNSTGRVAYKVYLEAEDALSTTRVTTMINSLVSPVAASSVGYRLRSLQTRTTTYKEIYLARSIVKERQNAKYL